MFNKMVCSIKGHDWTEWGYEDENKCKKIRTCRRDGTREYRLEHDLGELEYLSSEKCEQVRKCNQCECEEGETNHQFGEWEHASDKCYRAKECNRCHHVKEETGHKFEFTSPTQEANVGGVGMRFRAAKCSICGETTNIARPLGK